MLNRKKILFFVNISKISILVMMSIFLIGFFFPYYDYPNDAHVYGIQSIRMANGEYEFQNDLLKNSGLWEFTPHSWLKTSENFAVPDILPGLPAIGAFFYSITGNWGLFYFGPIITIVFLILCERISSKFFGPYVGLLTLVFLSTNEMVFWVGRGLLTSSIFSVIFILGVYFLIKFFNNNNSKYLLLTSICFTSITFIRLNGIILLPIEIIAVSGFFIINYYRNKNKNISTENSSLKITSNLLSLKKNSFIISSLIIPWLFFFLFFFSFNAHYFDDPLITIYNVPDNPRKAVDERGFDALQIDDERTKLYFKHFLPYPINRIGDTSTYSENYASEDILASNFLFMFNNDSDINFNNLGILSMFILISGFVFANCRKKNTIEINTFLIFLTGIILFYSTDFISISRQGSARDVLPILPFFYMILSYLLLQG